MSEEILIKQCIYESCTDLKEINKLVSYFENIKQENKLLKTNCNIGNDNLKFYREQYKNLQKRIDKAIEKLYCWGEALDSEFQKGMLDILQGNKEEK